MRARPIVAAAIALLGAGALFNAADRDPEPTGCAAPYPFLAPLEPTALVLPGRGFGHGVGMSQWGARGAALEGLDAEGILAHYYRGAEVAEGERRNVRVLLAEGEDSLTLSSQEPWRATGAGGEPEPLETGRDYRLTRAGEGFRLTDTVLGDTLDLAPPVAVAPVGDGPISLEGRRYRGSFLLDDAEGGIRAVNEVDLEDYLRGVVPGEVPAGWGDDAPAALQAQAIAARSYALATLVADEPFDLYADTRSQVYAGASAEDPRTDLAVQATEGRVLTSGGRVIVAYYSSSSGGHTEDGDRVFPADDPQPHLTGAEDPYDAIAPLHRWPEPQVFSDDEAAARLDLEGRLTCLRPVELGASPRVLRAEGITAFPHYGRAELTGPRIRAALELPDTWFTPVRRRLSAGGGAVAPPPGAPRQDVWLAVLNASGVTGLAASTAERAEELGYRAVHAGNAPGGAGRSTALYRDGAEEAAERVASDLGLTRSAPLTSEASVGEAPAGAQVVVVLRDDAPRP